MIIKPNITNSVEIKIKPPTGIQFEGDNNINIPKEMVKVSVEILSNSLEMFYLGEFNKSSISELIKKWFVGGIEIKFDSTISWYSPYRIVRFIIV